MKKILIITNYFPPYAYSLGGTFRITELANYLAADGNEVYVLTVKRNLKKINYAHKVNKNVKVKYINSLFGSWVISKYEASWVGLIMKGFMRVIFKVHKYLNTSIVDEHHYEVKAIIREAKDIIIKYKINNVIITYPSFSYSNVTIALKESFGEEINVISDFRDPWNIVKDTKSKYITRELSYEQRLIDFSDHVLFVSEVMKDLYNRCFVINGSSVVVENGFIEYDLLKEDDEFVDIVQDAKNKGLMVIGFFGQGTMVANDRKMRIKNLTNLYKVLHENKKIAKKVLIVLQGHVRIPKKLAAHVNIHILRPVPNSVARANMTFVDICLLMHSTYDISSFVMGGKVYDYIASGTPMWLVVPNTSKSLIELVEKNKKIFISDVNDLSSIDNTLKEILCLWEKDELPQYGFTEKEAEPYSRAKQFEKILPLLE